jgi:hypothetical protein
MSPSDPRHVSRRAWLGLAAPAALAAGGGVASAGTVSDGREDRGAHVHNIRSYGATGDGRTLDTAAVQAAIDACHGEGGGIVLVPGGDFLVGTIELKSRVTLRLAAHGRLLGSTAIGHYRNGRNVLRRNGGLAVLYAARAEDIGLEGPGTIDGQGTDVLKRRAEGDRRRPHLVIFSECKNVTLRGLLLQNAGHHAVRFLVSEGIVIDGVRIYNRGRPNADGLHFASSRRIHVSNCDIVSGDDACALFGSCQLVTVTNCTFSTRWAIFRFGGGNARNITVSNCVIYDTYGCAIKMICRAGSHYEDMVFSNLILQNVTGPIFLGLDPQDMSGAGGGGDLPRETPATPGDAVIRNILIDAIRGRIAAEPRPFPDQALGDPRPGELRQCIVLNGINGGVLENITISNVHLTFDGGGTAEEAARREMPAVASEYFRMGTPPAYGLYARSVRGLTVSNVRLETATPDVRPAVVLDHVTDAAVNGLAAHGNVEGESMLRLTETRDLLISASRVLTPTAVFAQLEGTGNEGITIEGGDVRKAKATVAFKSGALEEAVTLRA